MQLIWEAIWPSQGLYHFFTILNRVYLSEPDCNLLDIHAFALFNQKKKTAFHPYIVFITFGFYSMRLSLYLLCYFYDVILDCFPFLVLFCHISFCLLAKPERIVSSQDILHEDRELAVERNQYLILVGNLDIALCPPTIIEFLRRQTSLVPRVDVYPCLRSEPYTRGAILLDCESDFQKLWDFLTNPNHIIISSTGR